MRRVLLSVAVGLAGATAVAGAGWTLEAAALPQPAHADEVTAKAIGWLAAHPSAVDVFHAGHHRLHGSCSAGVFRKDHTKRAFHGMLLSLRPGPVVLFGQYKSFLIHGAPLPFLPRSLAAAVGCPGRIASTLDRAMQLGAPVTAERSYAANQPAVKIEIRRADDERLTLYVSPDGDRPLVAIVARDGKVAAARIYLRRATRRRIRRVHIPHRPARRRK